MYSHPGHRHEHHPTQHSSVSNHSMGHQIDHHHRPSRERHSTDLINKPIHFTSGQFAGQTVRAELHEIQKANLGRKYARVDRRPLDPPPAVLLRLFYVYHPGTTRQAEREVQNYDEVQILGLVCTVDLFPIPDAKQDDRQTEETADASVNRVPAPGSDDVPYDSPSSTSSSSQHSTTAHATEPRDQGYAFITSSGPPGSLQPPLDTVHCVGAYPVTESSKLTGALVGATFVQPSNVEYQGNKSLVFVFADLAVKTEGNFILRYRVFDIFSRPYNYHGDLAIQAECYGGLFRVYSTKEFPGLQASTELTKHLARWGVRLNIRETERKRRKKGEARSASPDVNKKGKRKRVSVESGDTPSDDGEDRAID